MSVAIKEIQVHWQVLAPLLTIHNESEYDQAIERLNSLLDEVGTDEQHPLYELLDTLGTVIHAYEEDHFVIPNSSGMDTLKYLMEEHELKQSDLTEIGSQGVVSEILSGKRQLNVRQIEALSQRFGVFSSSVLLTNTKSAFVRKHIERGFSRGKRQPIMVGRRVASPPASSEPRLGGNRRLSPHTAPQTIGSCHEHHLRWASS